MPAGGAKVLDGIGKELQLDEVALEPSRAVLHDYGNVSSSTTWYTLGYIESVRGAKKGEKLLQIGVGSGIKCGVNVWKAVRDVHDVQDAWAHRATDPSVLKQRRGKGSFGQTLLVLAVLVMLLAVAFNYAHQAGLLKDFEPLLEPVQDALQPLTEALQPVVQKVQGLLKA
jgi:3-ketoacyl-CoA synthase